MEHPKQKKAAIVLRYHRFFCYLPAILSNSKRFFVHLIVTIALISSKISCLIVKFTLTKSSFTLNDCTLNLNELYRKPQRLYFKPQ